MPRNYFDNETGTAFAEFQEWALQRPDIDLIPRFPAVAEDKLVQAWRELATRVYANWLSFLVERKASIHHPPKLEVFYETRSLL
jgi:hypothetical protein